MGAGVNDSRRETMLIQPRPREMYESRRDLDAEEAVAAALARAWKAELPKLPISYGLDRAVYKNSKLQGWVEIKNRPTMRWGQYPDIMVSVLKARAAFDLSGASEKPCYFVVADSAGEIRTVPFAIFDHSWIRHGGRTANTRDSADIEPVFHIPVSLFTPLKEAT